MISHQSTVATWFCMSSSCLQKLLFLISFGVQASPERRGTNGVNNGSTPNRAPSIKARADSSASSLEHRSTAHTLETYPSAGQALEIFRGSGSLRPEQERAIELISTQHAATGMLDTHTAAWEAARPRSQSSTVHGTIAEADAAEQVRAAGLCTLTLPWWWWHD